MEWRHELLDEFREESMGYLAELEAGLLALEIDNQEALLYRIFLAVHSIKGTAGLFELNNIVKLTYAMEKAVSQLRDGLISLDSILVDALLDATKVIREMVVADTQAGYARDVSKQLIAVENVTLGGLQRSLPTDSQNLWDLWNELPATDITVKETKKLSECLTESSALSITSKTVYLFEDSDSMLKLASQLENFGYHVTCFYTASDIQKAIIKEQPSAAIVSGELWFQSETVFPSQSSFIVISTADDIDTRLKASRAGAKAFCTKPPVPITDLIAKLDSLTNQEQLEPYRIFIVEDSPVAGKYLSDVLHQAGMVVFATSNPKMVLKELPEFRPDLILMDIYMPDYNGIELAQVIRQFNEYVSIPIVFLSSEIDKDRQLYAMSQGGDDFLSKFIKDGQLVASIVNRVERYRVLRAYMLRDSLTGLFNHTVLKDRLTSELARQQRTGSVLSFVMIDLDFFKNVNDTYGHHAGDQVLCALSRLLRQRLRQTDIIGRYGGEEFAVILTNTDGAMAKMVMEDICTRFAQVLHQADDVIFQVTMSCGIATSESNSNCLQIINRADQALYKAKNNGKNQVALL